ncbi:MAG: hypothetical protein WAM28_06440 [Chlamydiales bacterium]
MKEFFLGVKSILILLLLTLSQVSFCYGIENGVTSENREEYFGRHYVYADQIVFSEKGIVIYCQDGNYLLTQSIFHDENGYYYLEDGVQWICSKCGALNDLNRTSCYRCQHPA